MWPLAEALEKILNQHPKITIGDWARIIGINLMKMSRWIKGKDIPSPEHFRMIIATLEQMKDGAEHLEYLKKIEDKPWSYITNQNPEQHVHTCGWWEVRTLSHYLAIPRVSALLRSIAGTSCEKREDLLDALTQTIYNKTN